MTSTEIEMCPTVAAFMDENSGDWSKITRWLEQHVKTCPYCRELAEQLKEMTEGQE